MDISNLSEYEVEVLSNETQKKILGGAYWWLAAAAAILYNEINDVWNSGGDNLTEAYQAGEEWAKNN